MLHTAVTDVFDCWGLTVQGQRVLVIGGGKTSIDVALSTAAVADSTTLLARRGHWWAPQKVLGESLRGGVSWENRV